MRIDPSVRVTSVHQIIEPIELAGKKILKGQQLSINIGYLHHRPDQWIEPERYIPERFDPTNDKYYLTPSGKKRHPMSFGPFLGGKRVCLGKTLAESIGKCVLAVMMTQIQFDFVDPKVKESKPAGTFFHETPTFRLYVNELA